MKTRKTIIFKNDDIKCMLRLYVPLTLRAYRLRVSIIMCSRLIDLAEATERGSELHS